MNEIKKKRLMFIGRSTAGKTTLCQYLGKQDLQYHKTQTVQILNGHMIDTPGEYLERAHLRNALQVTSADADVIVLVQDATENGTKFPPAYSSSFCKPTIGIVTKTDAATDKQIQDAESYLIMAGARKVFQTSSVAGTGFESIFEYLEKGE